MVWVWPGIFPAIIRVAPNSPKDRANASAVAARIDRCANGSVTRQKSFHSLAPKVRAARSQLRSTLSSAAREDFTNRGSEYRIAATTAAFHVKTSGPPNTAAHKV